MIKFMVPLSFLLAAFHLASLMRDIWHPGFQQREWEGERHLEGGLSELSILPAAQQVKVTLYFVYFPPISICEQNEKKKKKKDTVREWEMVEAEGENSNLSFLFSNL